MRQAPGDRPEPEAMRDRPLALDAQLGDERRSGGVPSPALASPRGWRDAWSGTPRGSGDPIRSSELPKRLWRDRSHDIAGCGSRLKAWQALFTKGADPADLVRVDNAQSGWSMHTAREAARAHGVT